jgi:hypothetical protein
MCAGRAATWSRHVQAGSHSVFPFEIPAPRYARQAIKRVDENSYQASEANVLNTSTPGRYLLFLADAVASLRAGFSAIGGTRSVTRLLENPKILGVEYQQGTLAGYQIQEYVFEKFERHCAYCGITDVPLNLSTTSMRARVAGRTV